MRPVGPLFSLTAPLGLRPLSAITIRAATSMRSFSQHPGLKTQFKFLLTSCWREVGSFDRPMPSSFGGFRFPSYPSILFFLSSRSSCPCYVGSCEKNRGWNTSKKFIFRCRRLTSRSKRAAMFEAIFEDEPRIVYNENELWDPRYGVFDDEKERPC